MAVADDILAAIVAAGLGQAANSKTDWMVYLYSMQDSDPAPGLNVVADRCIAIYETGGDPPEEGFAMDYPGFQIRVRGAPNASREARAKLQALFDLLHANEVPLNAGVSPPSATYVYCYAVQSGAIPMGLDERRRPHFVQNYRTMRNRP